MRPHRGGLLRIERAEGECAKQFARFGVSGHGQVRFHD
jgi:hypothetical protein